MGAIEKIQCNNCEKSWEILTGMGKRHASLANISELYPADVAEQLTKYEEMPGVRFQFAMTPAKCETCKAFVSVPVVFVKTDEKKYTGVCPECGKSVQTFACVERCKCPECNEKKLFINKIGRWD